MWEAIALHTSPGIPERRGPLTFLTRAGAGMDFGKFTECISDDQAAAIHEAYPRLAFARCIVDDIVEQIRATPERGPMFSIGPPLSANARHRAVRATGARDCFITRGE